MHRWLSAGTFLLVFTLRAAPQAQGAPEAPGAPQQAQASQQAQAPQQVQGGLHVEAIEGDGAINSIRLHRGHDLVVRITSPAGEPLSGATVTFLLPSSGPSATFPDGGLTDTMQTDVQGRAEARGLRPNATAGQFQIGVRASSRGSVGAATLVQTNAEPEIKTSHTKLYVILAAVGGLAAGGAVLATRGKSSPADSATTAGGSITSGSPTFGPPH